MVLQPRWAAEPHEIAWRRARGAEGGEREAEKWRVAICGSRAAPRVLHLELSARRAAEEMSADAINYIKKPTEEFLRDSWRLVKRCTKPDRNGAPAQSAAPTHGHTARVGATRCAPRVGATLGAPRDAPPRRHAAVQRVCGRGRVAPRRSLPLRRHLPITASPSPLSRRSPPPPPPLRRVLQDRAGDVGRVLHYGLHWLLREAHLHPDQQHHRRDGLDGRSGVRRMVY